MISGDRCRSVRRIGEGMGPNRQRHGAKIGAEDRHEPEKPSTDAERVRDSLRRRAGGHPSLVRHCLGDPACPIQQRDPFSVAFRGDQNQCNTRTQRRVQGASQVQEPSDVFVVHNRLPPGGHTGWHTHPGPSIVSVKVGTATLYDGDDPSCTPVTYPAGTGFIDKGGGHVHILRNEGNVELETVVFSIVPQAQIAGSTHRRQGSAPSSGRNRYLISAPGADSGK